VASGLRFGVEVRRAAAADAPEIARLLAEAGAALSAPSAACHCPWHSLTHVTITADGRRAPAS
jgi:hypothetical protein